MLSTLFVKQAALDRHLKAPFLHERNVYLEHLREQGTSLRRLMTVASMLVHVIEYLQLETLASVDRETIQSGAARWAYEAIWQKKIGVAANENAFRAIATSWLRFHDALLTPPVPVYPFGDVFPAYLHHLIRTRAICDDYMRRVRCVIAAFLTGVADRRRSFAEVSLQDALDYILLTRHAGLNIKSIATVCHILRGFFRFTESKGWTPRLISAGIVAPSVPRYDVEPRGPRWSDVRRMLSEKTGETPAALRSKAILLLLAIYGMRGVEVSSLTVDDLDWEERIITIRRAKGGRFQRLPLTAEVGTALFLYFCKGRSTLSNSTFFLTLSAPYRPISHSTLRLIVTKAMRRLGVQSKTHSTHSLRHSCATQLLRKGISMDEIARFLGHRNNRSISIYAKCPRIALRRVAEVSLTGVL